MSLHTTMTRDHIHETATRLAHEVEDTCTGSGMLVERGTTRIVGILERHEQLATQTDTYASIYVAGRHFKQIRDQVVTGVFGRQLDDVDIEEHFPTAVHKVTKALRDRSAAAGGNEATMVNQSSGWHFTLEEVATIVCRRAAEQLRGKGRAITADDITRLALEQVPGGEDYVFAGEAAALWGVELRTWSAYVARGQAPAADAPPLGRRQRWHRSTVLEYQRPGRGARSDLTGA